jgi:hypothetical protein
MNLLNSLSFSDLVLIEWMFFLFFMLGLCLGFFAGWVLRHRYDFDQWLKRGIWCDDCAPEVEHIPGQGVDK